MPLPHNEVIFREKHGGPPPCFREFEKRGFCAPFGPGRCPHSGDARGFLPAVNGTSFFCGMQKPCSAAAPPLKNRIFCRSRAGGFFRQDFDTRKSPGWPFSLAFSDVHFSSQSAACFPGPYDPVGSAAPDRLPQGREPNPPLPPPAPLSTGGGVKALFSGIRFERIRIIRDRTGFLHRTGKNSCNKPYPWLSSNSRERDSGEGWFAGGVRRRSALQGL